MIHTIKKDSIHDDDVLEDIRENYLNSVDNNIKNLKKIAGFINSFYRLPECPRMNEEETEKIMLLNYYIKLFEKRIEEAYRIEKAYEAINFMDEVSTEITSVIDHYILKILNEHINPKIKNSKKKDQITECVHEILKYLQRARKVEIPNMKVKKPNII